MSLALFDATGEYLHSPVDDLESLFWVAFWSVLYNRKSGLPTEAEERIMDKFCSGNRSGALDCFFLFPLKGQGNASKRFRTFLWDWWAEVRDLRWHWVEEVDRAPDGAGKDYYLPHFHRRALQGVLDVLRVLLKHWNGEINWESWTVPTLPT